MKPSELRGITLDWAVSIIERTAFDTEEISLFIEDWEQGEFNYSSDWALAGSIIEREVIALIHPRYDCWTAHKYDDRIEDESYTLDGPTPLIAAMRCYVASKLGDEIKLPEGLSC